MARTRPMARKSTGGNAPRRTFAKKKARILGENGEEKCVDVVTCASCSAVVPESTATHAVADSDCDELGEYDDDEEEDDDKVFVCSAPHCQANLAITKIMHRQATRERGLFYYEMNLREASVPGASFFDASCVDPLDPFRYWVRPMETLTPDEIADPQNAISAYENKRHEKRGARMKRLNELDDIWNKLPEGEEKELARKNLVEFLESSKNAFQVFRGLKSDSESSDDDDDDDEEKKKEENST